MRIWDLPPRLLCREHLLGEHRELHAIWSVIVNHKTGYSRHPETLRWHGRLAALYDVHEAIVAEMLRRGYSHRSPLERRYRKGCSAQDRYVDTPKIQREKLRSKGCSCKV